MAYVAVPAVENWKDRASLSYANAHADDTDLKTVMAVSRSLTESSIRADSCRVMRQIIAAHRAKLDRATDRALAKRTDALGALFARVPKTERKPRAVAA